MIKKFFIFKEAITSNNPKLQKLVDEANSLLIQIHNKHGEGAHIESENAVFQVDPITYVNGIITIEYGTGFHYQKDRDKEIFEVGYDSEKDIVYSLKSWIKLFKKQIFNKSEEGKNKIYNKLKNLVEQFNILVNIAYDEYGYKISICDKTSSWEEECEYSPIIYEFGKKLTIKYSKTSATKIQQEEYDLETCKRPEELVDEIEDLIKQYRKFLKKEGVYPLTQKDITNLQKLIEVLDNDVNKKIFKKVNIEGVNPFFINKAPYKNKLDDGLDKYNIIPGIYMIQEKENIKIYISYYNEIYFVHEQYLSKIYKIYQSIKN